MLDVRWKLSARFPLPSRCVETRGRRIVPPGSPATPSADCGVSGNVCSERVEAATIHDGYDDDAIQARTPGRLTITSPDSVEGQVKPVDLEITFEQNTAAERATADQLRKTLEKHDVARWIYDTSRETLRVDGGRHLA